MRHFLFQPGSWRQFVDLAVLLLLTSVSYAVGQQGRRPPPTRRVVQPLEMRA